MAKKIFKGYKSLLPITIHEKPQEYTFDDGVTTGKFHLDDPHLIFEAVAKFNEIKSDHRLPQEFLQALKQNTPAAQIYFGLFEISRYLEPEIFLKSPPIRDLTTHFGKQAILKEATIVLTVPGKTSISGKGRKMIAGGVKDENTCRLAIMDIAERERKLVWKDARMMMNKGLLSLDEAKPTTPKQTFH